MKFWRESSAVGYTDDISALYDYLARTMPNNECRSSFFLFLLVLKTASTANWAQLAGQRAQNTATPYIPQKWNTDTNSVQRPMWTARWGHALVVVLNQSLSGFGNDNRIPVNRNKKRVTSFGHKLVLLGGDDYDNWNKEGLLGLSGKNCC